MNESNHELNKPTTYQLKVVKKHNYFYRITNQINWKYYFGIHSTNNLNDGYLGSGHVIKDAIKKYGKENFHLTIIQDYPTRKEASDHEKLAVTMLQVEDENCYNLRTGGDNETLISEITRNRISETISGEKNGFFGRKHSPETILRIKLNHIGIKRTPESIKKQSDAMKGRKVSPEIIARRSDYLKGRIVSESTRELIRQIRTGTKATQETKDKLSKNASERNPNATKCKILGIFFSSIKSAAEHFGISYHIVQYRINSKNKIWEEWINLRNKIQE